MDKIDALEQGWIRAHQPVLNTEGTAHGAELTELKLAYREGLARRF